MLISSLSYCVSNCLFLRGCLRQVFSVLKIQVPGEAELEAATTKAPSKEPESKSTEEAKKQRPLLPKSSILRLISEIIKSYCSCTQLITQHIYQAGQSELITEVIVALHLYTFYSLTMTTCLSEEPGGSVIECLT